MLGFKLNHVSKRGPGISSPGEQAAFITKAQHLHGLQTWIKNYSHYIISNFYKADIEVCEWIINFISYFTIRAGSVLIYVNKTGPGARPTKHISIEFEIRWKFRTL